jgi:CAAX prenyl protease-like protein
VSARAALLEQSLAPQAPGSTTPYLLPLFVLTLAGLVTEALAVRVDHLYFVRIALGAVCMWWLARSLTELAWSGRSFVYGLVAGVFGLLLWTWMIPLDLERQAEIRSEYEALSPLRAYAEIGVRLLGSALVVPVVEEYAFRGYLMRRLHAPQFDTVRYSDCSWSSLIGSSVVFGVLHGGDWLPATLCGFLFSLAARKANSLHAAVVAHTTTNAAIAAAVLLFGRYDWL